MSQIVVEEIITRDGNAFNEKGELTYEEWTEERDRTVDLDNIIRRGICSPNKDRSECLYWIDITSFDYPGDYDNLTDSFEQSHTIGITAKSYKEVNDLINTKFLKEYQKGNLNNIDNPFYGLEI